jgi:hypothetical protein
MDNSFRRKGSETQQPGGFLASLKIIDGILNWLADLIRLTEEERENAGIYLGRLGRK